MIDTRAVLTELVEHPDAKVRAAAQAALEEYEGLDEFHQAWLDKHDPAGWAARKGRATT